MTSKYDIINYFIIKIPLERMRIALYDTDSKESKRKTHLLWQIMSKYYNDNEDYFKYYFEKVDMIEIPILSCLNQEEKKPKVM